MEQSKRTTKTNKSAGWNSRHKQFDWLQWNDWNFLPHHQHSIFNECRPRRLLFNYWLPWIKCHGGLLHINVPSVRDGSLWSIVPRFTHSLPFPLCLLQVCTDAACELGITLGSGCINMSHWNVFLYVVKGRGTNDLCVFGVCEFQAWCCALHHHLVAAMISFHSYGRSNEASHFTGCLYTHS